jgi:hypothetical protein
MRDSNSPQKPSEKQYISQTGAEKSTDNRNEDATAAILAIMRLPLSDADKAEAVKQILRDGSKAPPINRLPPM